MKANEGDRAAQGSGRPSHTNTRTHTSARGSQCAPLIPAAHGACCTSAAPRLISAASRLYLDRISAASQADLELALEKLNEQSGESEKLRRALEEEAKKRAQSPSHGQGPVVPPKKTERRQGQSIHLDLDEGPDAPPIGVQLASALRSQSARVLDLFRDWDTDGDGEVSRKEFHKAMTALGLEVPHRSRARAHPLIAC